MYYLNSVFNFLWFLSLLGYNYTIANSEYKYTEEEEPPLVIDTAGDDAKTFKTSSSLFNEINSDSETDEDSLWSKSISADESFSDHSDLCSEENTTDEDKKDLESYDDDYFREPFYPGETV